MKRIDVSGKMKRKLVFYSLYTFDLVNTASVSLLF